MMEGIGMIFGDILFIFGDFFGRGLYHILVLGLVG
jgi:hypothetical protein